jgi:hypothetical protein
MPFVKTCHGCGNPFETKTRRRFYCNGPCFRRREAQASAERASRYSPWRRQAYTIVQSALVRGALKSGPCEVCGNRRAVAHHDDYAKPLDVRWLCRSHHRKHHVKHGPGANA